MARPVEIRVEDLHKSFDENKVLDGVDLEIRRGDLVALVGPSGCGKTVLLNHITGHLQPDRGRVLVADHEADGAPLADLATLGESGLDRIRVHMAIVFQRNALFSASVYENIALWLREIKHLDEREIGRRARAALDAVGFKGDDTILTKHRAELSGGMAKRVAVARALAMRPITIFYDEPTTGLDPVNAAQVHELILFTHEQTVTIDTADTGDTAEAQRTTIVVTHDKDLLRRIEPRVVMLYRGKMHFDGPFADFERSDSEIIRPYLETMPGLHARQPPTT